MAGLRDRMGMGKAIGVAGSGMECLELPQGIDVKNTTKHPPSPPSIPPHTLMPLGARFLDHDHPCTHMKRLGAQLLTARHVYGS